jgi:hypothetical protein
MKVMALLTARLLPVALLELHAALEAAGADAQEGDAVAVLGVHVGLDLEHEAGELRLVRLHLARRRPAAIGAGDRVDHRVEQALHAEVVDRRAEEHRRLLARQVGLAVEGMRGAAHQFDVGAQFVGLRRRSVRRGAGCRGPG